MITWSDGIDLIKEHPLPIIGICVLLLLLWQVWRSRVRGLRVAATLAAEAAAISNAQQVLKTAAESTRIASDSLHTLSQSLASHSPPSAAEIAVKLDAVAETTVKTYDMVAGLQLDLRVANARIADLTNAFKAAKAGERFWMVMSFVFGAISLGYAMAPYMRTLN